MGPISSGPRVFTPLRFEMEWGKGSMHCAVRHNRVLPYPTLGSHVTLGKMLGSLCASEAIVRIKHDSQC